MARVATISIHAVVMLAMRDTSHPYELDSIAAWFILSEVAAGAPIMLSWAASLRGSKARVLVKIWGMLVFVGAICAFVMVRWANTNVDGNTCAGVEDDSTLVYNKGELFRDLASNALLGKFDIAAVAAASFGLLISVRPDKLWNGDSKSGTMPKLVKAIDTAGLAFSSAVLIAIIVLHERYLLGSPRLAMLLPITSYEQWNCWAAAGLIISATILNWMLPSKTPSKIKKSQIEYPDTWLSSPSGIDQPRPPMASTKPWRGRKTDLEWAGVMGKPAPSHVR
jgi:hypothetical protein